MKKYLSLFLILFALCGFGWHEGETLECTDAKCPGTYELAMSPVFLGASGGAAAGTWYYLSAGDTLTETCTSSSKNYAFGGGVTIGAATNITKLAARIKVAGSATGVKIALYAHTQDSAIPVLAGAACSPLADDTWCIATVDYTAAPDTTYYVAYMSDADDLTQYCDKSGDDGIYGASRTYATFLDGANILIDTTSSRAVAICVGTCSSGP